jgi:hypothetical protein
MYHKLLFIPMRIRILVMVTKSWISTLQNILKVDHRLKTHLRRPRGLYERQETRLILKFGPFSYSWIRIQDRQMNADPCGSGSTTLSQRDGVKHLASSSASPSAAN